MNHHFQFWLFEICNDSDNRVNKHLMVLQENDDDDDNRMLNDDKKSLLYSISSYLGRNFR
jgi:hypothetical protein